MNIVDDFMKIPLKKTPNFMPPFKLQQMLQG